MSEHMDEQLDRMPFLQHLGELRQVLVTVFTILAIGTGGAWFLSSRILNVIVGLLPENSPAHIFSPPEAFLIRLKVSAATALFVGTPIVIYKIWSFVAPALYQHEKSKVRPLFIISTLLFYGGTAFSYLVITPITMGYFYRLVPEDVVMTVGITSLFGIVAKLCVAFGIVFQLPLIIFVLTLLGLLSPRWLLKQWRVAFIIMLVFSSVLTPPDVISQLAMSVPLFILYMASSVVALSVERRRRREEGADDVAEESDPGDTPQDDEQNAPDDDMSL
ncbi:MAG: twin-arginine translocase subunit TatC [bacterium]|nr:twin-arginine translocase subunit TatC [bacterium]